MVRYIESANFVNFENLYSNSLLTVSKTPENNSLNYLTDKKAVPDLRTKAQMTNILAGLFFRKNKEVVY